MFIRGGSWAGYHVFLLFLCFSLSCLFVVSVSLCFCLCFRIVVLSFCIYNRKNAYNNITNKSIQNSKKNRTTEKNINLPAGTWDIFIRGRVEGWISCRFFAESWKSWKNDAQRFFAECWKSWKSWKNDAQSFSPTINMCYRVCVCIIIYKCDRFACTSWSFVYCKVVKKQGG